MTVYFSFFFPCIHHIHVLTFHFAALYVLNEGQNNPHRPEGSLPNDGLFLFLY